MSVHKWEDLRAQREASKLARRFELLLSRLANYHALEAYCVQHYGVWRCFYRCETYAGEIMLGSAEEQATQLLIPGAR